MSRYSPTYRPSVAPTFAEQLRDGLMAGMQTFNLVRDRRLREQQAQAENARADEYLALQKTQYANAEAERQARLYGQGFRMGSPSVQSDRGMGLVRGALGIAGTDATQAAPQSLSNPVGATPDLGAMPTSGLPSAKPGTFDRASGRFVPAYQPTLAMPSSFQPADEVQVAPGLVYERGRMAQSLADALEQQAKAEQAKREAELGLYREKETIRTDNDLRVQSRRTADASALARLEASLRPPPGAAAAARPEKPTEAQLKAAFFYKRAEPAAKIVDQFSDATVLDTMAGKAGLLGNWLKTPDGKKLDQAARNWVITVLRQDSGGVIGDDEMEFYYQTYLPRPGDSPDVLVQKKAARDAVTLGLRELAGPAYQGPLPDVRADSAKGPPLPDAPAPGRGAPDLSRNPYRRAP